MARITKQGAKLIIFAAASTYIFLMALLFIPFYPVTKTTTIFYAYERNTSSETVYYSLFAVMDRDYFWTDFNGSSGEEFISDDDANYTDDPIGVLGYKKFYYEYEADKQWLAAYMMGIILWSIIIAYLCVKWQPRKKKKR